MCFSTAASLTAATVLLPTGAFAIHAALKKNRSYLLLAALPLLFGLQQLAEAGVWVGLEHGVPGLVKLAALTYLFFAIAFWPCWVPLAAALLEADPGKRRLFYGIAAGGLALGCLYYIPVVVWFDDWVRVGVVNYSIRYDFSALPGAQAIWGWVWAVLYLMAVSCPLLASRDPQLRLLGLAITGAALISHLMFWYAFASVWCFFAAALSVHICYALYRLPRREGGNWKGAAVLSAIRR